MAAVDTQLLSQEQRQQSSAEARGYKSPYQKWRESQGIPSVGGFFVPNMYTAELTPWEARGGSGLFINLEGSAGFNDAYVYELAPKESSLPIKHIYDELIFVLRGRGATTVWYDEKKKQTFEWGKGSYFAIPPNASHQWHNLSGEEPARYFSMTAAPRVIDTFKDTDFVFNCNHKFTSIFNDEDGFFQQTERPSGRGMWETNYIANVWDMEPRKRASAADLEAKARAAAEKGDGWKSVGRFLTGEQESHGAAALMLRGTVHAAVSFQSQPGTHSPHHRHGPGIHVTVIGGHGYSIMQSPTMDKTIKVNWEPGTVFVPPEGWWHSHYNVGPEPWDWLRVGWGSEKPKPGGGHYDYTRTPQEGGDQMAFEDMDPAIHRQFEEDCAKAGIKCLMLHHPHCSYR